MNHLINTLADLRFNTPYVLYSFLFACLYFYLGVGLALLFTPIPLRRYSLFLSPLLGYCYLTLIGWYCYIFDLRGTDTYARYLLLPPLVFLYLAGTRLRRRHRTGRFWERTNIAPVLIALIGFFLVSIPYFRDVHELTSISIRNDDIADSASVSTYLKIFARSDSTGFLGQSTIFRQLADRSIFGASYSTAFAGSIFRKESYEIQSLSVNVFFFFGVLLVYALARDSFKYDHYGGLLITTVFATSPVLALATYNGYQGQIFAASLAIALLLVHIRVIGTVERFTDGYPYLPLVVLLNWGISLTYPHMLPFVYAPLGAYAVLLFLHSKRSSRLVAWFTFTAATLGIMALLSPYRAVALVAHVILTARQTEGWFIPWYFSVFGISGSATYVHLTLLLAFGIVVAAGLRKAHKSDPQLFLLSIASLVTVLAGFIALCFMERSGTLGWGGYKSYKLFSFFLPLILASSLTIAQNAGYARIYRLLCTVCLAMIVLESCYVIRSMTWSVATVGDGLAQLRTLDRNSSVQSINILGNKWWNILWETDFLLNKRLYFQTSTYAGREASPLDGDWDLIPKVMIKKAGVPVGANTCIIPVGSSYVLVRACKRCRAMEAHNSG